MDAKTRAVALSLRETMGRIGRALLEIQEKEITVTEKTSFNDFYTPGDTLSEEILTRWAEQEFPEDGIRGEEGTVRSSRSGYEWVFDPIDGTTIFKNRLGGFAISAGRVLSGKSMMGAVYFPEHNAYFFASCGEGAWSMDVDGGLYHFPERKKGVTLKNAPMTLDVVKGRRELLPLFLERSAGVLRYGSYVYEVVKVVSGNTSAHIHTGATPFDAAAMAVIAEEAGCVVNGLDGNPIDLEASEIPIVTAYNQQIMDEVLEICTQSK
jgi:myo-inositol-1(or 4)-monophosphatase